MILCFSVLYRPIPVTVGRWSFYLCLCYTSQLCQADWIIVFLCFIRARHRNLIVLPYCVFLLYQLVISRLYYCVSLLHICQFLEVDCITVFLCYIFASSWKLIVLLYSSVTYFASSWKLIVLLCSSYIFASSWKLIVLLCSSVLYRQLQILYCMSALHRLIVERIL